MDNNKQPTMMELEKKAGQYDLSALEVIGVLEGVMKWRDMRQARSKATQKEAFLKRLSESKGYATPEDLREGLKYGVNLSSLVEKQTKPTVVPAGAMVKGKDGKWTTNVKPREIYVSMGDRYAKIPANQLEKYKIKGWKQGRTTGKGGVTEKQVKDELVRWNIKIETLKTGKGLNAIQMALAQSHPEISKLVKNRNVSGAIQEIRKHMKWLRDKYLNEKPVPKNPSITGESEIKRHLSK